MKRILKTILLLINITAVAALFFSGFGGHYNTASSTLPGIALMVFPLVLAATVVILLLDLLCWRRLAFLPLLAMLLCAVPIWNFCPMNIGTPKAPAGAREFKLMTYNVFNLADLDSRGDSIHGTLATILDVDADIVCLQESRHTVPALWDADHKAQCDSIAARYPHTIIANDGQTVLSRYPLRNIDVGRRFDGSACLQCVEVDVDGIPLTIFNVHLQSLGLNSADRELYGSITRKPTTHKLEDARSGMIAKLSSAMRRRGEQAHLLRHYIDSIGGANVIVAGDFNDIEDCYAQRVIEGNTLHSAFTSAGFGPAVTYNANRFYFNIDHILYGDDLKALKYRLVKRRSSDHYPVVARFALKP